MTFVLNDAALSDLKSSSGSLKSYKPIQKRYYPVLLTRYGILCCVRGAA